MFHERGQLTYGDEVVLAMVDFQFSNRAGTGQGLVTNHGSGVAYEVTTGQFIRFRQLLGTRNEVWKMVFADGKTAEILPQPPSTPETNFPATIRFSFVQNSPIR